RDAGLPARSCPSALVPSGAEDELSRSSERSAKRSAPWFATGLPPLQIQAKMPCASQASPDIRPHAVKAGLSPNQAAEPLSAPAANPPMCRSVRGTSKPHDEGLDRAGG